MNSSTPPSGGLLKPKERFEVVDGVEMYRISNIDQMDPFLMTIVSSCDLWMFLSTTGGLTAGRTEPADCIFPYETVDRLHAAGGRVGPATVFKVRNGDRTTLWEPFRASGPHQRRSLFKSLLGNMVIFEEEHLGLGLTFRSQWAPSDRFGWVRTASIVHAGSESAHTVEVVDGLRNVMPWGIDVSLQQRMSNLANAYRRSELTEAGIGLYTLEAVITDRPEPSEALRATTVWTTGLKSPTISVEERAVDRAAEGQPFQPSSLLTGRPGAFFVHDVLHLEPDQECRWHIVADVAQSHADIPELSAALESTDDQSRLLEDDITHSSEQLRAIVAATDGIHSSGSAKNDAHHLANTLFNVMRGGTFLQGQMIDARRFRTFVAERNRPVGERHAAWLDGLPELIDVRDLRRQARDEGDPDLRRLSDEYLPIGFSRRHGDPSRPWNYFTIRVTDEDGNPSLSYEGNWRDIFQNWEALCRTFPAYLPSMISKFLNASTADGFNPYRLTSEGIDWEIPDPDDPWSGIGYWGDHQIVYLLRLLEAQEAHDPGWLGAELERVGFSFADVPYRIAPYQALVENPKATVDYDATAEAEIGGRVAEIGADGKLMNPAGRVVHVGFLEKLLIPMLAKLSNYVPRGGIWMNTERPEWNDANNALVGYGLSMVTLAHLRRYIALVERVVSDRTENLSVSAEVIDWLEAVTRSLDANTQVVGVPKIEPKDRARIMQELGTAYDTFRSAVYAHGVSEPRLLPTESVRRLCHAALVHLDDSVRAARRPDGLYHAYNLLRVTDGGAAAEVTHLAEMLEGQVAVISSGLLSAGEVAGLLHAIYASPLFRPDVNSFILYPAERPPPFLDRNRLPGDLVESNPLLVALRHAESGRIIVTDVDGDCHFHPDLRNGGELAAALDELADGPFAALAHEHRAETLEAYEHVFHHHAFTGRSSTMYAYEGIGSVYWHMVAKLLLAVQEVILAEQDSAASDELEELVGLYFRVRDGLGFNKTAAEYGAFPTDPYSHTPAHAGAQQPGMTGQVKEELLTRWAELGLTVSNGSISFTPLLLDQSEFRSEPGTLTYRDVANHQTEIVIDPGSLGFTICQVPVVVHATEAAPRLVVRYADGTVREQTGLALDADTSGEIFDRTARVQRLDVFVPPSSSRSGA